jgi:pimeloyl-ACP methyl ester carboxylesterase
MRRWMAAPLIFVTAVGLTSVETRLATAQPPGPVQETFRTADGVELNGVFHATAKNPNTAPVVVFLYAPGADRDMTKGDWGGLAKRFTEEGYHVFQFDWRGHGKSTNIKDKMKFWTNPYLNGPGANFNMYIKGGPPKMPLKNELSVKDLGTNANRYAPAYLNDLAAVRLHLDTKNDNKELNASTIYVVGAGEAAGLGMAWLTAEWKRPAVMPNIQLLGIGATGYEFVPQPLRGNFDEAGADFGGAVWLTAHRFTSLPAATIQKWVANNQMAPKLRENNPMLFLYAEKDTVGAQSGKKQAEFFFNEVLVAEPRKGSPLEKLEQTRILEVKGAEKLEGVKLLGQNATLKTEDTIVQYFSFIQKTRQKLPSKARKYDAPYFIDVRYFDLRP